MPPLDSDRYSPAAQRLLRRAWGIARLRGIEEVPLDTLRAAVQQEDGVAREILEQVSLHERFPLQIDHLPAMPPKKLLSADVANVFRQAENWARELGSHVTVGSEHVLYGLLTVDDSFQSQCESAGLTLDVLAEKITSLSGFTASRVDVDLELELTTPPADDEAISLRIVDASLNRVREGLRAVEDYFRFGLGDADLSERCKSLRHRLGPVLRRLSLEDRTAVRDVPGDVGTEITVPSEQVRGSTNDVALANLSRVQESLRSAEEYAKTLDAEVAVSLESMRYRTYELEKMLARCVEARRRLQTAHLYLLVAIHDQPTPMNLIVEAALAGGVDIVQLRDKSASDAELLEAAHTLRRITRDAQALLIINDRADIARLCDADGVHLGQDDLRVNEARRILGSERLIGVSTHAPEQAEQARLDGADYLGVGPTFQSATKQFEDFPGLEYGRHIAEWFSLPAFAIGGINESNVESVVDAGIRRIAVSHAITHAEQPEFVAKQLRLALTLGLEQSSKLV